MGKAVGKSALHVNFCLNSGTVKGLLSFLFQSVVPFKKKKKTYFLPFFKSLYFLLRFCSFLQDFCSFSIFLLILAEVLLRISKKFSSIKTPPSPWILYTRLNTELGLVAIKVAIALMASIYLFIHR